jgi:hypothetical protein
MSGARLDIEKPVDLSATITNFQQTTSAEPKPGLLESTFKEFGDMDIMG